MCEYYINLNQDTDLILIFPWELDTWVNTCFIYKCMQLKLLHM